jgi:hypothetical protein
MGLEQSKETVTWLMSIGLSLPKAIYVLYLLDKGDSLSQALLKLFNLSKQEEKEVEEPDFGNPITP